MNTTKTDRKIRAVCKDEICWRKLESRLLKLQKRIYQAFILGNIKLGRRLQKTLIRSWAAKCLALKRANTKLKKKSIKLVPSLVIASLAQELKLNLNKRVALKPSSQLSQFKLVSDQALQILALMAIEPEKNAKRQLKKTPDSVSVFCQEHSKSDTVKAVFNTIRDRPQFLLQVKIRDCQSQTNFWLTKILVDRLLERAIEEFNWQLPKKLKIVKYREQILVFNSDLRAIEQFKIVLWQCLQKLNLPSHFLEMSIIHTLDLHNNERSGFDFLGFNFRQYVLGKHHAHKSNLQKPLTFKTIVTPNKEEIKKHDRELGQLIVRLKAAPANILIAQLNSKLAKWTNYYSLLVKKQFFHQRDRLLFVKLWHWAFYRHPRKSARFIWKKYWQKTIDNGWVFTATSSNSISV